jgi:DNA-binding SARP family transcriptional activator
VLQVRCLGAFSFGAGNARSNGPAFKRGREFLEYFFSYSRAVASREVLVGAFWPSLDVHTATHRLHLAAAGARAALRVVSPEADGIRCSSGGYAWDPAIPIESDARALLDASGGTSIEAMERAAASYAGEYLAGEDAEWIYPLRIRCANAYAILLERLTEHRMSRRDYAAALEYALRLIEADRAHENATCLAMQALAEMGRRGVALAVYDDLALYLRRHFAMAPSAATCELRESIVAGRDAPAHYSMR